MGRCFWIGCGFLSWGGGGGQEKASGQVLLSRFRGTTRAFKQTHFLCYILYIGQWRFHCCMLQVIAKRPSLLVDICEGAVAPRSASTERWV